MAATMQPAGAPAPRRTVNAVCEDLYQLTMITSGLCRIVGEHGDSEITIPGDDLWSLFHLVHERLVAARDDLEHAEVRS